MSDVGGIAKVFTERLRLEQENQRLTADLAASRFSEREWRDKAQDKIAEVETVSALYLAEQIGRKRAEDRVKELELERDGLVAYLGETADAIENRNVARSEVAALLRKSQAALAKAEEGDA